MLTLYLTRHAKSSKDDPALRDFDRPLNARGLRDAPFMARVFKLRNEPVDKLLSSPAVRALSTARYFAQALGWSEKDLAQDERIYLADTGLLMRVLRELPDASARTMLFGHITGFSDLAGHLTGKSMDLSTCATVRIDFNSAHWADVKAGSGSLAWSDTPKDHRELQ